MWSNSDSLSPVCGRIGNCRKFCVLRDSLKYQVRGVVDHYLPLHICEASVVAVERDNNRMEYSVCVNAGSENH